MMYFDYQIEGIARLVRMKNALLADEMGLGKTIQAIGAMNHYMEHVFAEPDRGINILIICPANLKHNWLKEFKIWSKYDLPCGIVKGSKYPEDANVVIINYDIIKRHKPRIQKTEWDYLILDEAHYLKNPKSARTKAIFGLKDGPIEAKRVIAITGTPAPNRPIELYPLLRYLDPKHYNSETTFATRYCNAQWMWGFDPKSKRYVRRWDLSGASNLGELNRNLRRGLMIRRLKKDVLKDLPPKLRQMIEVDIPLSKEEKQLSDITEKLISGKLTKAQFDMAVDKLTEASAIPFLTLSKICKETAIRKIPYVISHVKDCLAATDKLVVFCYHVEMLEALAKGFPSISVTLSGSTSKTNRLTAVDRFQTDKTIHLFIGNIKAAGVGVTLTASSNLIMAESSWVPGEISQAEDRVHRIGQNEKVLIQHLVLKGSTDSLKIKSAVNKQRIIDMIVD